MKNPILSSLFCLVLLIIALPLRAGAAELPPAFEDFRKILEESAARGGQKLIIRFDPEKGMLTVGTELQLNEMRKNVATQMVPVKYLEKTVELEGLKQMPEPWIKIRCKDGSKRVERERKIYIEGAEVEEVTKEESVAFIVIPCSRSDLRKAQEAAERFLGEVQP